MKEKNAKTIALRILSLRNHSILEIKKKLLQRGFSPEEIEDAILSCARWGYLNDEEETKRRAEKGKKKGYGPYLLSRKLEQAGLKNVSFSREEQKELLRNFLKKPSMVSKPKVKQIAAVQRRGFDWDVIQEVFQEIP